MAFCRNCGKEVEERAVACPQCGVPPRLERKFCPHCGKPTQPNQVLCVSCGAGLGGLDTVDSTKRITAGLLAIFLGWLGVHKFYLGYNTAGIIMLVGWLVSAALTLIVIGVFGLFVIHVVALIEGILYLTKSSEDFDRIYVTGRKEWF